jgi:hypothetical protein
MNCSIIGSLTLLLALSGACSSDKESSSNEATSDKMDMQSMVDEAGVDFARKQLAELDTRLASDDPGSASSICSVIEPDMPAIEKADAKLAETLKQRCGKDVAIRSLARYVEEAEAARAADPDDTFLMECSSFSIYMKPVIAAGAETDPEIALLRARFATACPGKE